MEKQVKIFKSEVLVWSNVRKALEDIKEHVKPALLMVTENFQVETHTYEDCQSAILDGNVISSRKDLIKCVLYL